MYLTSMVGCCAVGAESLRTAAASNKPDLFWKAVKLVTSMTWRSILIEKINGVILNIFNKHSKDFNNACKIKQELLNLVP